MQKILKASDSPKGTKNNPDKNNEYDGQIFFREQG